MNLRLQCSEAYQLAKLAVEAESEQLFFAAEASLVRLREFLNEQPQLEAGGSKRTEEPERSSLC